MRTDVLVCNTLTRTGPSRQKMKARVDRVRVRKRAFKEQALSGRHKEVA